MIGLSQCVLPFQEFLRSYRVIGVRCPAGTAPHSQTRSYCVPCPGARIGTNGSCDRFCAHGSIPNVFRRDSCECPPSTYKLFGREKFGPLVKHAFEKEPLRTPKLSQFNSSGADATPAQRTVVCVHCPRNLVTNVSANCVLGRLTEPVSAPGYWLYSRTDSARLQGPASASMYQRKFGSNKKPVAFSGRLGSRSVYQENLLFDGPMYAHVECWNPLACVGANRCGLLYVGTECKGCRRRRSYRQWWDLAADVDQDDPARQHAIPRVETSIGVIESPLHCGVCSRHYYEGWFGGGELDVWWFVQLGFIMPILALFPLCFLCVNVKMGGEHAAASKYFEERKTIVYSPELGAGTSKLGRGGSSLEGGAGDEGATDDLAAKIRTRPKGAGAGVPPRQDRFSEEFDRDSGTRSEDVKKCLSLRTVCGFCCRRNQFEEENPYRAGVVPVDHPLDQDRGSVIVERLRTTFKPKRLVLENVLEEQHAQKTREERKKYIRKKIWFFVLMHLFHGLWSLPGPIDLTHHRLWHAMQSPARRDLGNLSPHSGISTTLEFAELGPDSTSATSGGARALAEDGYLPSGEQVLRGEDLAPAWTRSPRSLRQNNSSTAPAGSPASDTSTTILRQPSPLGSLYYIQDFPVALYQCAHSVHQFVFLLLLPLVVIAPYVVYVFLREDTSFARIYLSILKTYFVLWPVQIAALLDRETYQGDDFHIARHVFSSEGDSAGESSGGGSSAGALVDTLDVVSQIIFSAFFAYIILAPLARGLRKYLRFVNERYIIVYLAAHPMAMMTEEEREERERRLVLTSLYEFFIDGVFCCEPVPVPLFLWPGWLLLAKIGVIGDLHADGAPQSEETRQKNAYKAPSWGTGGAVDEYADPGSIAALLARLRTGQATTKLLWYYELLHIGRVLLGLVLTRLVFQTLVPTRLCLIQAALAWCNLLFVVVYRPFDDDVGNLYEARALGLVVFLNLFLAFGEEQSPRYFQRGAYSVFSYSEQMITTESHFDEVFNTDHGETVVFIFLSVLTAGVVGLRWFRRIYVGGGTDDLAFSRGTLPAGDGARADAALLTEQEVQAELALPSATGKNVFEKSKRVKLANELFRQQAALGEQELQRKQEEIANYHWNAAETASAVSTQDGEDPVSANLNFNLNAKGGVYADENASRVNGERRGRAVGGGLFGKDFWTRGRKSRSAAGGSAGSQGSGAAPELESLEGSAGGEDPPMGGTRDHVLGPPVVGGERSFQPVRIAGGIAGAAGVPPQHTSEQGLAEPRIRIAERSERLARYSAPEKKSWIRAFGRSRKNNADVDDYALRINFQQADEETNNAPAGSATPAGRAGPTRDTEVAPAASPSGSSPGPSPGPSPSSPHGAGNVYAAVYGPAANTPVLATGAIRTQPRPKAQTQYGGPGAAADAEAGASPGGRGWKFRRRKEEEVAPENPYAW